MPSVKFYATCPGPVINYIILFLRTFCGLPSEVPSFGSGIIMNASPTDELYEQNGETTSSGE